MMKKLAMLVFAAVCSSPVSSQIVYRCGDTFSQSPCAGASVMQLKSEGVSAEAASASRAATRRDAKLADAMEKERLKAEARPANVLILPTKAVAQSDDRKPAKAQLFTAVSPRKAGAEKQKKAKRKTA
jgi:hypothetical protein